MFWPNEGRYKSARAAIRDFGQGNVRTGVPDLIGKGDHPWLGCFAFLWHGWMHT